MQKWYNIHQIGMSETMPMLACNIAQVKYSAAYSTGREHGLDFQNEIG